MVALKDADALICGLAGSYMTHLERIDSILGRRADASNYAAVNALMTPRGPLFITDTYVNEDPSAEQLAEIAAMAAAEIQRFGIVPKVAFLSHSTYGSSKRPSPARCVWPATCSWRSTPTSNAMANCMGTRRSSLKSATCTWKTAP